MGMVRRERFLPDHQRPPVERLGVSIATLVAVDLREVVERSPDIGMAGTECFLFDRQRSLESAIDKERDGLQTAFKTEFPDYAALSMPEPLTVREVQSLLA